jgi:hypothetical protein
MGDKMKYKIIVDNKPICEIEAKNRNELRSKIPYNSWLHGINYEVALC